MVGNLFIRTEAAIDPTQTQTQTQTQTSSPTTSSEATTNVQPTYNSLTEGKRLVSADAIPPKTSKGNSRRVTNPVMSRSGQANLSIETRYPIFQHNHCQDNKLLCANPCLISSDALIDQTVPIPMLGFPLAIMISNGNQSTTATTHLVRDRQTQEAMRVGRGVEIPLASYLPSLALGWDGRAVGCPMFSSYMFAQQSGLEIRHERYYDMIGVQRDLQLCDFQKLAKLGSEIFRKNVKLSIIGGSN